MSVLFEIPIKLYQIVPVGLKLCITRYVIQSCLNCDSLVEITIYIILAQVVPKYRVVFYKTM